MKILYISRFFPYIGGRETMVMHLAETFATDNEVSLLTPDMGRPSLNFETVKYPEDKSKIKEALHRIKPDVINSHTFYLTENVLEAAKELDIPVCLTLHGDLLNYGKEEDVKLFMELVKDLSSVVAVCDHGYRELETKGKIKQSKLELIPNGINTQLFKSRNLNRADSRTVFGLPADKFIYLTPVRMTPYKGVDFLIDAISEVKDKSGMHFVISTPPARHRDDEVAYTEKIFSKIKKNVLENIVSLMFFDYSSMPLIYNLCDAFILPSQTEQLPISIMEAQASQLPVIATNVGGVNEVVIDDNTGLLVEYNDVAGLAEAINKVYCNTSLRERISKAGRDHILSNYSLNKMTEAYMSLYRKLVK